MSKIRILDPTVANQIAAGEVVERPASVLKELLENAVDAGAARLRAELEAGGRSLVALEDDGEGMDRDDALLAVERHATSKLDASADLDAIRTLGFRGEALPSIASVSRFRLTTRAEGDEAGTRVEIDGGTLRKVEETGSPVGTRVEVRNLFYNLPARRKFLRTTQTELGHCLRVLEETALARPELRIEAQHNDRGVLDLTPARDRLERIADLYGGEPEDWLAALEERPEIRLELYASSKPGERARGRSFLFWVNGRPVQDRSLVHAVREAWGRQKGVERPGLTLVFLDLPSDAVDVNIHPAKAEVRLREQGRVHDFLRDVLARTLREAHFYPEAPVRGPEGQPAAEPGAEGLAGGVPGDTGSARQGRIAEAVRAWTELAAAAPELEGVEGWASRAGRPGAVSAPAEKARREEAGDEPPVPLTQYDESYIIAHDARGLLIVDQHVAHERVLFEKILGGMSRGEPERQALLLPLVLELSPHQARFFEPHLETLAGLGFEVEPFGGSSFQVKAAPADLPGPKVEATLLAMVEDLEEGREGDRHAETVAASLACHAAIKVNHPLTPAKMRWLLEAWWRCGSPMVCPHGRPVALRLSHLDLERAFLRR